MSIGSRISMLRRELDMTQIELAERTGVSFQAVSSWERDEHSPELGKLKLIAQALGVKTAVLLDEEEDYMIKPDFSFNDRLFDEERMYTFIKGKATALKLAGTLRALPYAREQHKDQRREGKGAVPYINHPLTMVCHALAMGVKDDDILSAILLHDVVEDCGQKLEDLPCNEQVRDIDLPPNPCASPRVS